MKHLTRITVTIAIILGANLVAVAQKDVPREELFYSMELTNTAYSEKISILRKTPNHVRLNSKKMYFWYLNNAVHTSLGGFSGKLLHGPYTSYYVNMNLRSNGVLKLGLKNKEWRSWYENGQLKSVEKWRKGLKFGKSVYFSMDGMDIMVVTFKKNLYHGKCIILHKNQKISIKKYRHGELVVKRKERTMQVDSTNTDSTKHSLVLNPETANSTTTMKSDTSNSHNSNFLNKLFGILKFRNRRIHEEAIK